MAKYKGPRVRAHERLQAQAARARTSGPVRSRCETKKPMRALARFRARVGRWEVLKPKTEASVYRVTATGPMLEHE